MIRQGFRVFLLIGLMLLASACTNQTKQRKEIDDSLSVSSIEQVTSLKVEPIIHLSFNENSGFKAKDSSDYLEPGFINYVFNSAKYQQNKEPQWFDKGINGSALLFDGYSTYLEYDQTIEAEELSIVVWVAPRAFEWGDKGLPSTIASQYNSTAMEGFQFGVFRHGSFGVELDTEEAFLKCYSLDEDLGLATFINTFTWTQLAFTYNAQTSELSIYKNGNVANSVKANTDEYNPIKTSISSLMIGKNNESAAISTFSANMFNGLIDEFRVYDTALSKEEIKKIYEEDLAQFNGKIPTITYEDIALNPELVKDDINRPTYHLGAPQHWMNEPHGAIYYNGYYHIFYQHNPYGPFWHQIHWGHAVSEDMIHWKHLPVALSPTYNSVAPDGIWSGSTVLDREGNPVIFFTAGNDSKVPNQSIGIAKPKDLTDPYLTEWVMEEELVVTQGKNQGKLGEFRDPFVWFDEVSNTFYMLVCSGLYDQGGTALLYYSDDLYHWEYNGPFLTSDYDKYPFLGENWELSTFFTLENDQGETKDIFLFNPHGDGAHKVVYYYLGSFDRETMTFIKEHDEPKQIDLGHFVFSGPSGFKDPTSGKNILFTIAQGDRVPWDEYYAGWAHNGGMPMELSLDENGNIAVAPIRQVESLRKELVLDAENITLEELGEMLKNVDGDALDIEVVFEKNEANEYGLLIRATQDLVEKTEVYYDNEKQGLYVNRLNSSLDSTSKDITGNKYSFTEDMSLRILLDRSLVEIYVNNERSLTTRIYPTLEDATKIMPHLVDDTLTMKDIMVKEVRIYTMNGID